MRDEKQRVENITVKIIALEKPKKEDLEIKKREENTKRKTFFSRHNRIL